MHVNGVTFRIPVNGAYRNCVLYHPKTDGNELYSEKLGNLTVILWDLAIASGTVLLALGYTQEGNMQNIYG